MIRSTEPYAASTVRLFLCLVVLFAAAGCVMEVGEGPDPGELEPVNPSRRIMALTMPPCHTALASFDGTTAYSNGSYTGTGSSCGGSAASGLRYQCPEVVMRHFLAKWGFRWWGNAKDLLANAPKDKTNVYYNGDAAHPPVPGDALIWTTGSYGHVALISSTTTTSVSIIEQNWAGNGTATFAYANGTIASRGSGWVPAGWVHAKANTGNGQPGPQPPPPPPPVNWTCNQSSYQGQQLWTCSGGTLYRCENGTPVKKSCPSGCNANPLGVDDTCKSTTPPPAANQPPTGWLQVADCNGIKGWAQDPDGASATVDVRIRIDQGAPIVVKANESRPELCTQLGSCSHGYTLPLPAQFRDGKQHTVQVEALDLGSGPAALLKGSPKTFTCSSTTPSSPPPSGPPPSTSPNDDLPDPGTNGSGASAESIAGGCNLASSPADGGWTVLALLLLVVLRRRTHG